MGKVGTPRYKKEAGNRYGKLRVISLSHTDKHLSYWNCLCDCGNTITTRGSFLRNGKSTSCGKCVKRIINDESVFKRRWRSIKAGAKQRNLSVDITYDEFKQLSLLNCHYCNSPPAESWVDSRKLLEDGTPYRVYAGVNGLDRVNSDLGYSIDNLVSCCLVCNRMKSDLTYEEFYRKVTLIYENRSETRSYQEDNQCHCN